MLDRGRGSPGAAKSSSLLGWLRNRLVVNLEKARFLLTLHNDAAKGEDKPVNEAQHYLKSAEVIERLQEYAFMYSAATFEEDRRGYEERTKDDAYEAYLGTADFLEAKGHKVFYLDSGMQALNVAALIARKHKNLKPGGSLTSVDHHPYYETSSVRSALNLTAPSFLGSPDIVSADFSPVLKDRPRAGGQTRLSPDAHMARIAKSIAPKSIPILDVTNTSLRTVSDLVATVDDGTKMQNFIIVESLVKHSQLGADKFISGRLVVVGDEAFLKEAEEVAGPIADKVPHPLVDEFRRNLDQTLYGGAFVLSSRGARGLAGQARAYDTFVVAMGYGEAWQEATAERGDIEEEDRTQARRDGKVEWDLLRRAFDGSVSTHAKSADLGCRARLAYAA